MKRRAIRLTTRSMAIETTRIYLFANNAMEALTKTWNANMTDGFELASEWWVILEDGRLRSEDGIELGYADLSYSDSVPQSHERAFGKKSKISSNVCNKA